MTVALLTTTALAGCKSPEELQKLQEKLESKVATACAPLSEPWKGFEKGTGYDIECCARANTFAKHGHYIAYFHKTRKKALEGEYNDDVRVGLWHAWKKSGAYDSGVCYDKNGTQLWREDDDEKALERSCP
jgi:hypothetical protein